MLELLDQYRNLLLGIDRWFAACVDCAGNEILCRKGCSACCRGLFEISLLDARLVQDGFVQLEADVRAQVLVKARRRVSELQSIWPEFLPPYILNRLPSDDWQEMPEDDPTPCPLLSDEGRCLVYSSRPLTCRLHGLPNIDCSGESFSDEYCTLNFTLSDPLVMPELRYSFRDTFAREFELLGALAQRLTGRRQLDLDTFIASALLIDFAADFRL